MKNRENKSRKSLQAWRGLLDPRMELKDDNGEGLDWLNPLACEEASELAGQDINACNYTRSMAHFTSHDPYYYAWCVTFGPTEYGEHEEFNGARGVRFDTKYEGRFSGEGDERYYT